MGFIYAKITQWAMYRWILYHAKRGATQERLIKSIEKSLYAYVSKVWEDVHGDTQTAACNNSGKAQHGNMADERN